MADFSSLLFRRRPDPSIFIIIINDTWRIIDTSRIRKSIEGEAMKTGRFKI